MQKRDISGEVQLITLFLTLIIFSLAFWFLPKKIISVYICMFIVLGLPFIIYYLGVTIGNKIQDRQIMREQLHERLEKQEREYIKLAEQYLRDEGIEV